MIRPQDEYAHEIDEAKQQIERKRHLLYSEERCKAFSSILNKLVNDVIKQRDKQWRKAAGIDITLMDDDPAA